MLRGRTRRHKRIRQKVIGTAKKPRMCVFRSSKNIYAQLIDDISGKTLFALCTRSPEIKKSLKYGGNVKAATALGEAFAKEALKKGFKKVAFDRAGYLYHGRVKALADSARKAGLDF